MRTGDMMALRNKNIKLRIFNTRELTISYEPLDNVYHILDLGDVKLRIDFMSYF